MSGCLATACSVMQVSKDIQAHGISIGGLQWSDELDHVIRRCCINTHRERINGTQQISQGITASIFRAGCLCITRFKGTFREWGLSKIEKKRRGGIQTIFFPNPSKVHVGTAYIVHTSSWQVAQAMCVHFSGRQIPLRANRFSDIRLLPIVYL